MYVRAMFSSVMAAGLTLAFMTFGCGGAQEEPRGVSRPLEIGTVHSSANQSEEVAFSEAIRQQLKACIDRPAGQWSERSYAVQFDAKANDRGDMVEVKIRNTTMRDDEVVECLRKAIAAMTVPEDALRPREVRPFSGGERMMRERRGPMGNSESENPFVLLGPFIVEAVGIEVIIEVGVMMIAAVGTLVEARQPKDECLDKYEACMDTPLGSLVVDKWGHSVCETCREICKKKNGGEWPSGVKLTHRWQTCG